LQKFSESKQQFLRKIELCLVFSLKDFEAYAIEVLNLPDTVGSRVQVVKSLQSLAAGMIKNEFDKDIHDLVKLYFGVV